MRYLTSPVKQVAKNYTLTQTPLLDVLNLRTVHNQFTATDSQGTQIKIYLHPL